ncbi:MAG: NAD(P)H-dependent oxidoreductase subunit E [Tissierellaceae bacterium]|nr:NAD(P)H-dependent oxidoreductase subunit E [Tissierellaceae bacterium]
MNETKNKDLIFQEMMDVLVDSFGIGSQEGVKASLTECQKIFDCVSINHQQQIAELFQLDKKVIGTMIKFMPHIKESIVEYEVVCCSGSRCAKNGSIEVLKTLKETLGIDFNETTKDGKIRLSTKNCFKKCNLGPNIMVNGKFHHKMDKLKSIELMNILKNNCSIEER